MLPRTPRCSSAIRTAMPRDDSNRFLYPTFAYTVEFFRFDSLFCVAQTGHFFRYILVLGIIISKYLVLKVKNDLSAA